MYKYFEILSLPDNANWRDIKARYRILSLLNHPDRGGDARRFLEIQQAYEALRKQYETSHRELATTRPVIVQARNKRKLPKLQLPRWRARIGLPFRGHLARRMAMFAILCAAMVVANHVWIGQSPKAAGAQGQLVAQLCPTGQPTITTTSVHEQPYGDGQSSYTVSGRITNGTTADMMIEEIGFYVDGYSGLRAPDWQAVVDDLSSNGDLQDIPAGQSITFADTDDGPSMGPGGRVDAVLVFPRYPGMSANHEWAWLSTNDSCQPY